MHSLSSFRSAFYYNISKPFQIKSRSIHADTIQTLVQVITTLSVCGITSAPFLDKAYNAYSRYSAPNISISPIPKPNLNLDGLSKDQKLLIIRKAFSSPQVAHALNQTFQYHSKANQTLPVEKWIGQHQCRLTSLIVAASLEHMGFKPKIMAVMEMRPGDISSIACAGHVWVELEPQIILDLSCKQYTKSGIIPRNLSVPHGAIGDKQEFMRWIETSYPQKKNSRKIQPLFAIYIKKPSMHVTITFIRISN